MARHCKTVTGVDLSQKAVGISNEYFEQEGLDNCHAQVANGETLNFDSASFDLLQLVDVVHHAEHPHKLLKEASRVLKDNGRILVFEPKQIQRCPVFDVFAGQKRMGSARLRFQEKIS